jgi:hypothetical protein
MLNPQLVFFMNDWRLHGKYLVMTDVIDAGILSFVADTIYPKTYATTDNPKLVMNGTHKKNYFSKRRNFYRNAAFI